MLFGSSILEVVIGVIFLFLLLSVIVSAVAELIAQWLALRSRTLYDAVSTMLFDPKARDELYKHPLIQSLSQANFWDKRRKKQSQPSYIPSDRFARALIDTFKVKITAAGKVEFEVSDKIAGHEELELLLTSLANPLSGAVKDAEQLGAEAAKWFDQSMDRVSGWYRRKTQVVLFVVGAVVVVWANANVITYAEALLVNPTARAAIVGAAEAAVATPAPDASPAPSPAPGAVTMTREEALAELRKLDFAIGWDASAAASDSRHLPTSVDQILPAIGMNLLGWLLTTAALTMGAPFWFDVLKNVIGLRATGPAPKSTSDAEKPDARSAENDSGLG